MPLYDFICKECKIEVEKLCSHSQIDNQECAECGAKLEKKVSATENIKFTGIRGSATM